MTHLSSFLGDGRDGIIFQFKGSEKDPKGIDKDGSSRSTLVNPYLYQEVSMVRYFGATSKNEVSGGKGEFFILVFVHFLFKMVNKWVVVVVLETPFSVNQRILSGTSYFISINSGCRHRTAFTNRAGLKCFWVMDQTFWKKSSFFFWLLLLWNNLS